MADLEFSSGVSAPTGDRHRRVNGNDLAAGDTTAVAATDVLKYRHIVDPKPMQDNYIRGSVLQETRGVPFICNAFPDIDLNLTQTSWLTLDKLQLEDLRTSHSSGTSSLMVDGVMVHEFRHVYNTSGATSGTSSNAGAAGYKWGANADVTGARALFCGAQSLAMADIGLPEIVEDTFDYENQAGISIGKIFGLRKPKYNSDHSGSVQDFGVIALDTAQ